MYLMKYAVSTHPGRIRINNEDNFWINGVWRRDVEQPVYSCQGKIEDGYLLAAVCDGMGGEDMGEVASLLAVEALNQMFSNNKAEKVEKISKDILMKYVEKANSLICDRMIKERKRLGTTVSVLEFSNNSVIAMNLGDSRIYRLRGERLQQLSVDHTVVGRMVRQGQLTQQEAMVHPMNHIITQYLGIFPEEMIVEPAVTPTMILENDDQYLICSDGLTDMLSDEELKLIMQTGKNVSDTVNQLMQRAVEAGGRDNITVILIEVQ